MTRRDLEMPHCLQGIPSLEFRAPCWAAIHFTTTCLWHIDQGLSLLTHLSCFWSPWHIHFDYSFSDVKELSHFGFYHFNGKWKGVIIYFEIISFLPKRAFIKNWTALCQICLDGFFRLKLPNWALCSCEHEVLHKRTLQIFPSQRQFH